MNAGQERGMGGMGMGTGRARQVPPLKRYLCPACTRLFLHRSEVMLTCPHCKFRSDQSVFDRPKDSTENG